MKRQIRQQEVQEHSRYNSKLKLAANWQQPQIFHLSLRVLLLKPRARAGNLHY
jgi:hypothetical protein